MKTPTLHDLLERYKIDVELFNIEDTFDIENMAYKRKEIINRFNELTKKEKMEFLMIDSKFNTHVPEIKKRYPKLYELVIKPANEEKKQILAKSKDISIGSELIGTIAGRSGVSKKTVEKNLRSVFRLILEELEEKGVVKIPGIGMFKAEEEEIIFIPDSRITKKASSV